MKSPSIQSVNGVADVQVQSILQAMKDNIEILKSRKKGQTPIPTLPSTATLAQVIAAVNEIITLLNS